MGNGHHHCPAKGGPELTLAGDSARPVSPQGRPPPPRPNCVLSAPPTAGPRSSHLSPGSSQSPPEGREVLHVSDGGVHTSRPCHVHIVPHARPSANLAARWGAGGYSHCQGSPHVAPPSALPPALTPLTSVLHGGAVDWRGPPTRSPDSPGYQHHHGPPRLPARSHSATSPRAPSLSPGAVPLQEPRSPERSSRCHSDAGRCRAQRDRCKMLAGCHCRGECPSGEQWRHQEKRPRL